MSNELKYIEGKIAEYGALLEKYMIARAVILEAQKSAKVKETPAFTEPKPRPRMDVSISDQARQFVREHGPVRSGQIIEALNLRKHSSGVYTALAQDVKTGVMRKNEAGFFYYQDENKENVNG